MGWLEFELGGTREQHWEHIGLWQTQSGLVLRYSMCLTPVLRRQGIIQVILLVAQVQLECFVTALTLEDEQRFEILNQTAVFGVEGRKHVLHRYKQ